MHVCIDYGLRASAIYLIYFHFVYSDDFHYYFFPTFIEVI